MDSKNENEKKSSQAIHQKTVVLFYLYRPKTQKAWPEAKLFEILFIRCSYHWQIRKLFLIFSFRYLQFKLPV